MGKEKPSGQYQKDQMLTVEITDIGNDGEGIGKIDGYTLFIKDAVIGDKVSAKVMKAKKNFLGNIFEGYIKADEDIGREELQFRVLEQTKAQLKNLHKENANDARI